MNKRNATAWIMPVAFLLTGFAGAGAMAKSIEASDSEQVASLLSEAKTLAYQVKEDAQTMESFTRMNVSWETHKVAVNQIREHVNALGRLVAKLKAARDIASPWQRTAIDRINPYLDELGGYTSAVIEHLNGDKKRNISEYQDYLEANADYASDLCNMISDFVDYGKTRQRMDRLSTKLEVAH